MEYTNFNLKKILTEKGWAQERLADTIGRSRTAVNKLANRPAMVRVDTVGAICRALDITPNELFAVVESTPVDATK